MKVKQKKQLLKKFEETLTLLEDHECKYEDLFQSIQGKHFGKQITDIVSFTEKGIIITLFERIFLIIPKILEWTTTDEFNEFTKEGIDDPNVSLAIESFQQIIKSDPNWYSEIDFSVLFGEHEQMRFVAYFVIGCYSYLEGFVERSVDYILDSIIKKPEYYSKILSQDVKEPLKQIFKSVRMNPFDQLQNLMGSLGFDKTFRSLLKDVDCDEYISIVKEITEFRNIIAHKEPFPDYSVLELDELKHLKKYIEDNIFPEEVVQSEEMDKIPKGLQEVFQYLIDVFIDQAQIFSMISSLPEAVIIYTMLVDIFITFIFK